jgi:hypothetical protein
MSADEIRKAMAAEPFKPFRLHTPNGRVAVVPHRDFISMHPNGRTVVVFHQEGGSSLLDTMLVTELEYANGVA